MFASIINHMKNIIYLFLLSIGVPLFGQGLSKDQLTEDLVQLKEAIQTYNPALDSYNPNFSAEAESLISSITADQISPIESYGFISQLCALSNEGHFSVGTWEDEVHAGFLNNEYRYIPISVRVSQGKLVLWIDNSMEQSLNRGDEILSINGLMAKEIMDQLYKSFPSDGSIKTYVDRNIERGFSWMYYLYVDYPDTFQLEIKDISGSIEQHQIQALTRDKQFENYARFYPKSEEKDNEEDAFFTLKHVGEVSYLTLPSFDFRIVEKYDIKSKRFYKDIFSELEEKKVKYLVIDLRGNTGGRNEFADDIVPYIQKNGVEAPFLKKTVSWEGKTKTYKMPGRSKLAFSGKIYVLVDGRTYSAGNTLARYLREYANATMIGEETGTRYEGFAAGSNHIITLKNSQTEIGIPRYHIVFPKSEKQPTSNRGLLPKYHMKYTMEDMIKKKDIYLEKVQLLIQDK